MDQTENGCLEIYLNCGSSFLSVGLCFSIGRLSGDFPSLRSWQIPQNLFLSIRKFRYILKKNLPYFEVEILVFNIRLKDKTLFEYFNYLTPLTDSKF